MRQAQALFLWTLAAALPSLAVAQTTAPTKPPAVLDPAAPVSALHFEALPSSAKIVDQTGDWKAANAAVAQFPRGHADVIRWEKSQAAKKPSPEPPTGLSPTSTSTSAPALDGRPHQEHLQHGGQP